MKKTEWFSGDVKPARPGVYERISAGKVHFSRWTGLVWMGCAPDLASAMASTFESILQDLDWRGLDADPTPPERQAEAITIECVGRPAEVSLATIIRGTGDLVAHVGTSFSKAVRITLTEGGETFYFIARGDGMRIVWEPTPAVKEG